MRNEKLTGNIDDGVMAEDCIADELLLSYFEGSLTENEKETVQKHLNSCHTCFQVMASLAKNSLTTISDTEKEEIAKLLTLTPEQQAAKIISYAEELSPPPNPNASERAEDAREDETVILPKVGIWRSLGRLFELPKPIPQFAFVLSILIAAILISLPLNNIFIKKDRYDYYVYDDRVPYEYDMSSLRGASDELEGNAVLQPFISRFKLGMSDYMIRNYQNAISTFDALGPQVHVLEARLPNEGATPWIRDFYFYKGVSHLALLRSKRLELDQSAKSHHGEEAIQSLIQANALVRSNNLERNDREAYFLGLAYGFGGQQDSAVAQLSKIEPESQFYEDSAELIHEWSKQ